MHSFVERAEWRPESPALRVVPSIVGAVPPVSDEEREHVCDVIESYGYWGTEIPAMLGLVES